MNNYAQVLNGIVVNVILSETNPDESMYFVYDENNPAGIGYSMNELGDFIPPQPFPSWVFVDGRWAAPIAKPLDENFYTWDETNQSWVAGE
jgi:hypothetical protein